MTSDSSDFVLLASFLQNKQSEKQNATLRLIHDIVQGTEKDKSLLTKDLELSVTELKDKQLDDLKSLWAQTHYPNQTISHMVKIHNSYTEELVVIENLRLIACAEHIKQRKDNSANPHDITAESLGINTTRRPVKKLPPTHITSETGANFGVDPQTGKKRSQPLLYPTPVNSLREVTDVLIYLPNTKHVDLRPSLENVIKRGQLLGFGERHFASAFKLFIHQHFPQYNSVFQNGITAEESFLNLLVVFRSHDVATTLKDCLKKFCRQPAQSFTEFATILDSLACRVVRETHLQMSQSEANEFARDKLLIHLPTFTGPDVRKLFENQRATALRSNKEFYSYEGAVLNIYKIEQFVKPPDIKYNLPSELYNQLTSDSSLQNTVMLQAIQLAATPKVSQPLQGPSVEAPIYSTDIRNRSKSPFRGNQYRGKSPSNNYQNRSGFPSPNRQPYIRQSRSPGRTRSSNDHQSNPNHSPSPHKPQPSSSTQGRSNSQNRRPFSGSRNQYPDNRPQQPYTDRSHPPQSRPFSNSRQQGASGSARTGSRSPGRNNQGTSQRAPSPGRSGQQPRPISGDRRQQQQRGNSRDRAGSANTPPSRDNRPRSASQGRQDGASSRNRSRERDQYRRNDSRSPSAGRKSHCPYCGKGHCRPGECSIFHNSQFSQFPCALCPTDLYHRTSAHHWLV